MVHEDRMSGTRIVWYSVDSIAPFQCNIGESTAKLVVGCEGSTARVILGTSNCAFFDDEVARYRTESSGQEFVIISPQKSGSAVNLSGVGDKLDASMLVADIIGSDDLLIRISPTGSVPADIDFDISGIAEAAGSDLAACTN
jgi:hypothetical protein